MSHARPNQINIAFFLLLCLLVTIYCNTYKASWHFDDKPNILNNHFLHLKDLHPASLLKTFYTNPKTPFKLGDEMFRPVACLTFGLNWYVSENRVVGYHIVNISIHFLSAYFLFLTLLGILNSPRLYQIYSPDKKIFIAILTVLLWSINPVHTQAVTYIVQRMTLLATMFTILGIYTYLRGRSSLSIGGKTANWVLCGICFVLALGSKENAVMLPFSIILLDIAFFQPEMRVKRRFALTIIILVTVVLILGMTVVFFLNNDPFKVFKGFAYRPFSLIERLMTEARVVIYYLSQIFYPVPQRLSIEHDIVLSTSLLQPWTTLPAILIILAMSVLGLLRIRKNPLVSFSTLFFLLNHVVESTILPLELIFEHRNYLPSLFLFLPCAVAIQWLLDKHRSCKTWLRFLTIATVSLIIFFFCFSTYQRNFAWQTEISLWQDAALKAPGSARPLANLAWILAYGELARLERYDEALRLYRKAMELTKHKKYSESILMNNIAGIYVKKKKVDLAISTLAQALELRPNDQNIRYDLSSVLVRKGHWDTALDHLNMLLDRNPGNAKYHHLKGMIYLRKGEPHEALKYFRNYLRILPDTSDALLKIGFTLNTLGYYQKAAWFLKRSGHTYHDRILQLLCLIENRISAGQADQASHFSAMLIEQYPLKHIQSRLTASIDDNHMLPLATDKITAIIAKEVGRHVP